MRLLLCSMTVPWPDRPLQGAYHVSQALAACQMGHDVEIFSPAPSIPRVLGRWSRAARRHLARPEHYQVSGVEVFTPRVPFAFPNVLRTRGAAWAPRMTSMLAMGMAGALRRHCRAREVDGILAHGVFPWGMLCTQVAGELGIPVCFIEHSSEDVLRLGDGSAMTRHYRQIAGRAKGVFVVGRHMRDHLESLLPEVRVELIPNGVTPQPADLPPRAGMEAAPRVLAACHYYRRKGLEELVGAWPAVVAREPGARLEIHTNAPSSLRQLVMQSPAREAIDLSDLLPGPQLRRRMAVADLFALPSSGEAFGLVYAEALSVGTPVVMTHDCGLAEEVGDVTAPLGYVIADRSTEAVADALVAALADRAELHRRGQRGIAHVAQHYTWQANAAAVIRAFSLGDCPAEHPATLHSRSDHVTASSTMA